MSAQDPPDRSTLIATHSPEEIRRKLLAGPEHSYLKDSIYGAIDGAVTTFAVVAGVAGAELSSGVVIILGIANLIGTRSERQLQDRERQSERHHIETYPEGEVEEIRQIFLLKGFTGKDLERAVEIITSNDERWLETMLREQHGISGRPPSEWRAATTTFVAFLLVGMLPVLPYVVRHLGAEIPSHPFQTSAVLTGLAFFAVGALKGRYVRQPWHWSGLETLLVGAIAAALAYFAGAALKGVL